MQKSLDKRIASLEQANPSNGFPKTIIISYLTPGETKPDIRKLQTSYRDDARQEWTRGSVESEQEFTDRASQEVTRKDRCIAMLFQCD